MAPGVQLAAVFLLSPRRLGMEKPYVFGTWAVRRLGGLTVSPQNVVVTPDGATHGILPTGELATFATLPEPVFSTAAGAGAFLPSLCAFGDAEDHLAVRTARGVAVLRWPGLAAHEQPRQLREVGAADITVGPIACGGNRFGFAAGMHVQVWDSCGEVRLFAVSLPTAASCMALLDLSQVVIGARSNVTIVSVESGAVESRWDAVLPITGICSVDGGARIVTGHADRPSHMRLRVWVTATQRLQHVLDSGAGDTIRCGTLPDGLLASWGCGTCVRVWDLDKALCRRTILSGRAHAVATCSDHRIAVLCDANVAKVYVIGWRRRRAAVLAWTAAFFARYV